jgi:hypothetical protein
MQPCNKFMHVMVGKNKDKAMSPKNEIKNDSAQ